MTEQKLSFPTEVIELPTKGIIYPKDNPLSEGKIEMKYLTSRSEDILTNQNYIQQGIVLDKLLEDIVVSKINLDDLVLGDKDALLISARILGYGKYYEFKYNKKQVKVDLTKLDIQYPDEKLFKQGINSFDFTFPNSGTKITFKFLTGHDEKKIDEEVKGLEKLEQTFIPEGTIRLKYIITSVNGDESNKTIRDFVENNLLAIDAREFRKYIRKIQPGIVTKITPEGLEEEVNIPIGINFFWPDLEI